MLHFNSNVFYPKGIFTEVIFKYTFSNNNLHEPKKKYYSINLQNTKLWQTNIYNIFFSTKWIISVMKSTSITQVSFKRVLWTTPFCNGIPYRLYMNSYEQHQYHTKDMTNQKLTNGPIDCSFSVYIFPPAILRLKSCCFFAYSKKRELKFDYQFESLKYWPNSK